MSYVSADIFRVGFPVLCLWIFSCSAPQIKTEPEYLAYLNKEESGLVKIRKVNGLELKVKYLPEDYLINRELKNIKNAGNRQRDSLAALYKGSLSFCLSMGPDAEKGNTNDIMLQGLRTYQEYTQRSQAMNFEMEQYVSIHCGDREYRPVLSALQNTYGLGQQRDILLVFVPKDKNDKQLEKAAELDLVYADELFGLGTLHFVFAQEDIKRIPAFPYVGNNT